MKAVLPIFVLLLAAIVLAQPAQDRPFSIRGKVVDGNGNPVVNARIQASLPYFSWTDGRVPMTYSDESGRFVIGVPRVGTYTMTAVKIESGTPSLSERFYHPDDKARPVVMVEAGSSATEVTLTLPNRFASISGTIVSQDSGKPIPSATIRLCRLEAPNYCSIARIRDRSGKFNLAAIDGAFSVEISDAFGYEDWFMLLRERLKAGSSNPIDVVLVRENADHKVGAKRLPAPQIVFPIDGAELSGFPRVTTLRWSPVAGAETYSVEIEACQGGSKEQGCIGSVPLSMPRFAPNSGLTETTYTFDFIGGQPGRWRVWAIGPDGIPGKRSAWMTFYYNN